MTNTNNIRLVERTHGWLNDSDYMRRDVWREGDEDHQSPAQINVLSTFHFLLQHSEALSTEAMHTIRRWISYSGPKA